MQKRLETSFPTIHQLCSAPPNGNAVYVCMFHQPAYDAASGLDIRSPCESPKLLYLHHLDYLIASSDLLKELLDLKQVLCPQETEFVESPDDGGFVCFMFVCRKSKVLQHCRLLIIRIVKVI